jgi:dihydrolipoamide dehydrogenase
MTDHTTSVDTTSIDSVFDVIIIGAGPVGENVADRVTRAGLSAATIEQDLCSYWACMPTKSVLRSTAALRAARQLPGAREAVTGAVDSTAVLRRRDGFASRWTDDGQASWLSQAGITLYRGQGRIDGPRSVEVIGHDATTTTLGARDAVVVATR